jgi:ribose/xylose/arabinose/galactoside ABC-type transport system permease subunit
MAPPAALVHLVEPWSHLYSDSKLIPTVLVFAHIAALVFAGGLAVTLDRATLRAARGPSEFRWRQLDELASAHRLVVIGLALSFVTGVLLFTADLETFFVSWIFWTKMMLIVLLLINGYAMTRTESRIRETPNAADPAAWKRLRTTAAISMTLWFVIAFAGVALAEAL